jgi:hypothetical protein
MPLYPLVNRSIPMYIVEVQRFREDISTQKRRPGKISAQYDQEKR